MPEARVGTARTTAERLQAVTAAFSRALSRDDVLAVAVDGAIDEFAARAAHISLLTDDEGSLERACERASAGSRAEQRTYDSRVDQLGFNVEPGLAALPLRVADRLAGVFVLDFGASATFSSELETTLQALAVQCAQALERAGAYATEHAARAEAERAREELERIGALTDLGLAELAFDEFLETVLGRLVRLLEADAAVILLPNERGELTANASVGLDESARRQVRVATGQGVTGRVIELREPAVVDDLTELDLPHSVLKRAGMRSLVAVPLIAAGRSVGVLLAASRRVGSYSNRDVPTLRLAGDRLALAIDNARAYEQHVSISRTLQQSLLPDQLPSVTGMSLSGRYLPATVGTEVGGDWYDALVRDDGTLVMVIGDVVGHGVEAAATMGMLRNAAHAYLLEGTPPAATLALLDRFAIQTGRGELTTAAIVIVDPSTGELELSAAGHPPPLLVSETGAAEFAEQGRGLPLGVGVATARPRAQRHIGPGGSIVMYTDGLIDRRGKAIDQALGALRAPLEPDERGDPQTLIDAILQRIVPRGFHEDDIAMLVARLDGR